MAGEGSLRLTPSEEPHQESVLETIAAEVEGWGTREGWGSSLIFKVNLVLDELATNIIVHGGKEGRRNPDIVIEVASRGDEVIIEISDDGRPFDPLSDAPPPPAVHENLEAAPVGGLGIHLVKNMVDSMSYRRENGRNRVTMTARREQPVPAATTSPRRRLER